MRDFIKKSNINTENQAEEIIIHLRGKAKDVVKFGIRNSDIDIERNPDAVYGLLRILARANTHVSHVLTSTQLYPEAMRTHTNTG